MAPIWFVSVDDAIAAVASRRGGLTSAEAEARRRPLPRSRRRVSGPWGALGAQILNPLVLMLLVAAGIAFAVGDREDALIILVIVAASAGVGFQQQRSADHALERLLRLVHTRVTVRRDDSLQEVYADEIVEGDVIRLSVGDRVPGDARVVRSEGLHVDESLLTGESVPVCKGEAPAPADAPVGRRASMVFQGTHVVSGVGEVVVVGLGSGSELGRIAARLAHRRPPTDFDLGLQRFGRLLATVSLSLVIAIFAINVALQRPPLDAFMFAVALAVGLVPELLPAVVTVSLARGAHRMAEAEVLVCRLSAIEDFGAVDVLCADKTGTLTEGRVALAAAVGVDGAASPWVRELGRLNAAWQSGYANPIDVVLRGERADPASPWRGVGEVPYDFTRRRLSVLLDDGSGRRLMVTKGQLGRVIEACATADVGGELRPLAGVIDRVEALHGRFADQGLRVLAVASRELPADAVADRVLEENLTLHGLLAFADPVRPDAGEVVAALERLGVRLKILTGDDHRVARQLWRGIRAEEPDLVTGAELRRLAPHALLRRAADADVFAELEPAQKERIVVALRHAGHVVAYLGDGINDAPALRTADVGISVEGAADVAREAADLVLRRPSLDVVTRGVREGRRTMVNTLKYVHYTASANFGNMLSMAAASWFLPFLPLLPKQILLNNLLSDLPALTLPSDRVDPEDVLRPRRWRSDELRRFVVQFGALSSLFDLATFGALVGLTGLAPAPFRSAWFVGSLWTEVLVLLVLRTRRPVRSSAPGRWMTIAVLGTALVAVALPCSPLADMFEVVPLPPAVLAAVTALTVAYVVATEALKRRFFRAG